jgi:hypothetical protein
MPGLKKSDKKVSHFPLIDKRQECNVRLKVKSGFVYINAYAVFEAELTETDRIDFLMIGNQLFFYKCQSGGYKLFKTNPKMNALTCSPVRLLNTLDGIFYLNKVNVFEVTQTAQEYKQSKLYKIDIPNKYKKRNLTL